jgi:hypothetical protein
MGNYDHASGDLWCAFDASQGREGQREMLHILLLLLAGLALRLPLPHTIDEEWEQVRLAIEKAAQLAQQWSQTALMSEEDVHTLLARWEHLAVCHHTAGELAGHRSPSVARQAYLALQARRSLFTTLADDSAFACALSGESADESVNDALVDFDRSQLRARWLATATRPPEKQASFGDLALPLFPRSARTLRSALARAASWSATSPCPELAQGATVFRQVRDETGLAAVIHVLNTWLIDTYPQAAVRLHCRLSGDAFSLVVGAARLYHLSLTHEDAAELEKSRPSRDLWVLFADRHLVERRALEGAWQRFLRSWLTWSEVQCEDLATGFQSLWEQLEHPR